MPNDLSLARRLIKECHETQNPYLDLGNCGIEDLNDLPELFDCTHLQTLRLSNTSWFEYTNESYEESICSNKGWPNTFDAVPLKIERLKNLKKLLVCGCDNGKLIDIHFLEKLSGLHTLDLSENQISDYSSLEKLTGLYTLDLSGNKMSDYSFFKKLSGLRTLDLSGNKISDIRFLEKLNNLRDLDLSGNKISDYSFLEKLSDLHTLDLSGNQISNIRFLEKLTDLQDLSLRGNKISDYSFLEKLSDLHTLDLGFNQISDIRFLEHLTGLKNLGLYFNQISDVHFLEKLTGLKNLDLGSNQISDVHFLEKLTGLHTLNLTSNQISDIRFLEKLTGLHTLDLGSNQISDYSFIEKLTGLDTLKLVNNQISDIRFLEKLSGLHVLDLTNNQISDIHFIEKLTGLHTLKLGVNQISDIRFLEKLTGLRDLQLGANQISDIGFLEKLTGLRDLQLGVNQISDICFLEKLTGLHTLDLSNNQISDIRFLEKLTGLHTLYLSFNKISDIHFLEKLAALKTLTLQSNQIKKVSLPFFQSGMAIKLGDHDYDGLSLSGNPLESPPLEIIRQGKQSVFDWFEASKKKLNEIKIILIGDPKAGKTSLLRRLKENTFDENEVQTDGVNIEDIHFGQCETFKELKSLHKLTAHFWDFGGQEIMNATHQFFLTNRSVYLLVLDARKDTNVSAQIRHWLKRVKTTSGKSPTIVIASQTDVNPGFGFANEFELQEEFPEIKYFIKVSCKTGDGIDYVKQKLAELIPKAELFNTSIDERWINIKEQLQEETKSNHFLDETRFIEICRSHGLNDKAARVNAINFLNDLGLILHFEDLNLAAYYVLDPYWITYGVYQIVTSGYAGKQKGEVDMSMLEYIVNEEEDKKAIYQPTQFKKITYDTNQRRFLVDILNQFKLCFYLSDHCGFIIPDLLDTTEPVEITEEIRKAVDCIRFVYAYDYLPKSIMPYIMVETHPIIEKMWRTGCVLKDNGSKALISSYQDMLTIIVTGEHKKKREFMAIIRHLINSINQKLSDKPQMLIPLPGVYPNSYAEYEVLLNREKKGRRDFIFDEDKPSEKSFEISQLLEGIADEEEMKNINRELQKIKQGIETIIENQDELKIKLDEHYQYLIRIPKNSRINDKIIEAVKEVNALQTADLKKEILERIADAFTLFNGDMDDKLEKICNDLKKTDDLEAKLKLSVPLINLLGIEFGVEWDVKSWATKMYEKYKLKIFQLMV